MEVCYYEELHTFPDYYHRTHLRSSLRRTYGSRTLSKSCIRCPRNRSCSGIYRLRFQNPCSLKINNTFCTSLLILHRSGEADNA